MLHIMEKAGNVIGPREKVASLLYSRFILKYYVHRGEGRPLYLFKIMPVGQCGQTSVNTSVFSFTMLTATNVLCSSIKDCLNLEIRHKIIMEF